MTISPEQHSRIRRLFFGEHWKVGTIATELGVHPDTVKRAIETGRFATKVMKTRPPSMLDAYKPFILDVLDQHPRLRATRILQMLRVRGYVGGYTTLRRGRRHGARRTCARRRCPASRGRWTGAASARSAWATRRGSSRSS